MDEDVKRMGPTMREQVLASGRTIQQDFRDAVRFVFFDTGVADYRYATHGGTAFIVNYCGKCYGVTAAHVLQDFDWKQLIITEKREGTKRAPLRGVYQPSAPRGEAVGSDILDVAVLEFIEPITCDFFEGTPYILDGKTAASSADGHRLLVAGNLKEQTTIVDDIAPVYLRLEFNDVGIAPFDPTLRVGEAKFAEERFKRMTGVSGAPVYDLTANVLCGMVVRGGQDEDGVWRMHFVDMFDIMHFLDAIHSGNTETDYRKTVRKLVKIPVPTVTPPYSR
jgi:hypothetical protein